MVTVSLYKPGAVNYSFPFPQEWNEFTTAQLQAVANAFYISQKEEAETKAAVLFNLLNMHRKKLPMNTIKHIDIDDLATVGSDLIQFIWEDNHLTRQPYPVLRIGWRHKFTGPADGFDNLTCGEYEQAEIELARFNKEKKIHHLAAMAAILYRPKGVKLYSFKPSINEYELYQYEKMIPAFLKLPPEVLYTIFLWYCGCRNMMVKYFPYVYSGGGAGVPDILAFTRCIHAAAGDKNGSRQQVRLLLVKELHFEMNEEAKKAEELEKKYAQQS